MYKPDYTSRAGGGGGGGVGVLGWIERGEQVPGKAGQEGKEQHVVAQRGALDVQQRS